MQWLFMWAITCSIFTFPPRWCRCKNKKKCSLFPLHMDGTLIKCIQLRLSPRPGAEISLSLLNNSCGTGSQLKEGRHRKSSPASLSCHVPGEEWNGPRSAPWPGSIQPLQLLLELGTHWTKRSICDNEGNSGCCLFIWCRVQIHHFSDHHKLILNIFKGINYLLQLEPIQLLGTGSLSQSVMYQPCILSLSKMTIPN